MSKPKLNDLYTPSGERLANQPDVIPWDVYPRPTLRRDSYCNLNGWWDFAISTDGDAFPAVYDKTIRVPYCPESLLSGVHEIPAKGSWLFYRRSFADDGIIVRSDNDKLSVDLHIAVIHGINIAEISKSIVNKVRYTVEEATGLQVKKVSVFVDGMKAE